MFSWFRSKKHQSEERSSDETGTRNWRNEDAGAGYYATQDPYGSALDEFDEQFDYENEFAPEQTDRPARSWKFWRRKRDADQRGAHEYLDDLDEDSDRSDDYYDADFDDAFGDADHLSDPGRDEHRKRSRKHRRRRSRKWRWLSQITAAVLLLFFLIIGWLLVTAPLSKSLEPIAPPQITLLASDGTPIARSGASVEAPVEIANLPDHVIEPFLAIEDRRFYSHWGVDPRGIARAAWTGVGGGSTITQQLAKFTFLTPEQTLSRKAREALIAFWLEAWLTKDEILERYLSNAYFGDNQYGLRAASLHYFYRKPENLLPEQAAMLAGLLKAPSRLAPSKNYDLAQERMAVVVGAMVDAGYLTQAEADAMPNPGLDVRAKRSLPTGTYFADWALKIARQNADVGYAKQALTTTLDAQLQRLARKVTSTRALKGAQVALVAMRSNGEVVAMIGGRDYAKSSFNRATQASRQPGSTFKLFTYAAALDAGMDGDDMIDNSAIVAGNYRPRNSDSNYSNSLSLEEAFAKSSNVATVRLFNQIGSKQVIAQARAMGITSELPVGDPSLALGSASVTLLELTSAYAGMAANRYPIRAHAFAEEEPGWLASFFSDKSSLPSGAHEEMEEMLRSAINHGTGKAAMLRIPNFGKTGTTQNNRDALFVGYAGDLVVGVWVGNDDNSPLDGVTGGGLPATIWRDFMVGAIAEARAPAAPKDQPNPAGPIQPLDLPDGATIPLGDDGAELEINADGLGITTELDGQPIEIRIGEDGVEFSPQNRR